MSEKRVIPASELIINEDGSIFHLHLRPEELADNVILVGDPGRVDMIAEYFDEKEFRHASRARAFVPLVKMVTSHSKNFSLKGESAPASTAINAPFAVPYISAIAFISKQSVRINPSKPSSFLKTFVKMFLESVAGTVSYAGNII